MKTIPSLALVAALAAFVLPASAEDARAIAEKFEAQKAEALAAYLAANPAAPDAAEAEAMLISAYVALDRAADAAPLLLKRYEALPKGDSADLQELIGGVIQPLFQVYSEGGMKDEALAFIARAGADLASHPQAAQISQFFQQLTAQLAMPGVGDTMEIAFTAMDGREIDLAKMNDQVVLVDFWATWCGPCIAELPHVVKAYEKFHDKGFEVLGISLDEDKAALEGFVAQRGLKWPQLFDGKGWGTDLVGKYGIRGIPATFLVGKDGKIVATDLRGDDLERHLSELLGE